MKPEEFPLSGFNAPQTPQDELVVRLFEKHGLSETPSLADIEPVAKKLWESPATRGEAIELVLGRRVDAREFSRDPILRDVYLLSDSGQAFGCLLLIKDMERHTPPAAEQ